MTLFKKAFELAGRMLNPGRNRSVDRYVAPQKDVERAAQTIRPPQVSPAASENTSTEPARGNTSEQMDAETLRHLLSELVKSTSPGGLVEAAPDSSLNPSTTKSGLVDQLIPATLEEHNSDWRTLWLTQLVCQVSPGILEEVFPAAEADQEQLDRYTRQLVNLTFDALDNLSNELNTLLPASQPRVTTTKPADFRETLSFEISGQSMGMRPKVAYYRCRASTSFWSLSVRGRSGAVEFFLVPGNEVMLLSQAEPESRLKVRLRLYQNSRGSWWTLDGLPVNEADLRSLVRSLMKDLLLKSASGESAELDTLSNLLNLEGERLTQAIHQLVMEKQNLVQKIVMQQEEIQNRIARDLHDAVISDVMLLKRSLSENKRLSEGEINLVLDRITSQLREICHDLAPRDLKDWGLQTVIDDMLQRVSERIGADCALHCESEIPDLPNAVQLHIFRIVQECLNNIEKYSAASRVLVRIEVNEDTLSLTIEDNGKGFSPEAGKARRLREGGSGLGSIRERAELICAFYPANLSVESVPNSGSKITLLVSFLGTAKP
jgi:signal transduction histidine kinase